MNKKKVDKEKALQMWKEGKSIREIANAFGAKTTTIKMYLAQMKKKEAQKQTAQTQEQAQEQEKVDAAKASLPNAGAIA